MEEAPPYTQVAKLQASSAKLESPGGPVPSHGQFIARTKWRGRPVWFRTFVVDGQTDCLLARGVANKLGVVQRVDNTVFGQLDDQAVDCEPVKISLREDAEPYSLHTARRVPIPLLSKVKEELEKMEKACVIEKITEPSDWCAPMVPVLKPSGKVRICTDYKKLNVAVKRERYMLPTLDDLLFKLRGSAVFSRLDATSGFHQLPLDKDSQKLTAFIDTLPEISTKGFLLEFPPLQRFSNGEWKTSTQTSSASSTTYLRQPKITRSI